MELRSPITGMALAAMAAQVVSGGRMPERPRRHRLTQEELERREVQRRKECKRRDKQKAQKKARKKTRQKRK